MRAHSLCARGLDSTEAAVRAVSCECEIDGAPWRARHATTTAPTRETRRAMSECVRRGHGSAHCRRTMSTSTRTRTRTRTRIIILYSTHLRALRKRRGSAQAQGALAPQAQQSVLSRVSRESHAKSLHKRRGTGTGTLEWSAQQSQHAGATLELTSTHASIIHLLVATPGNCAL